MTCARTNEFAATAPLGTRAVGVVSMKDQRVI